ncbi:ganglioside-induced differentiation-associated protein 1 [Marchantia polymorpha subsp. ruderalis]
MAGALPVFYTYPLAFNPAKAKIALDECNIKYVEKKIDILSGQSLEPWFLKLNPGAWAPTLVVGENVICESAEIVKWADAQGTPLGGDKVDRQFIDQWVQKVDNWDGNLFAAAFGPAGGVLKITTEHKIKICEAQAKRNPDLAELYQKKAAAMKAQIEEPNDKAKCEANKAQLISLLDEAESRLATASYLAGEEYSIADVIFTPCLYRIPQVKLDKELIESRNNVQKYWASLKKRPSYKKAFGVSESPLSTASTVIPAFGKILLSKITKKY